MILLQGNPEKVIPVLAKAWQPSVFTFESDTEPYAISRDNRVSRDLQKQGITVHTDISHTIYDPHEVMLSLLVDRNSCA